MSLKKYFLKRKHSKKGFTMVEMIASICVLAIISTISVQVIFAVQNTVRHTGEITANQYSTTQIEKFIRNEFQIATGLDITTSKPATSPTKTKDDEIFYYDSANNKVCFQKIKSDGGSYEDYLVLEDVNSVAITIVPLKNEADSPLKLTYAIDTKDYKYEGGIVMGNTKFHTDIPSLPSSGTNFEWEKNSLTNDYCITFHSESKQWS